MKEAYIVTSVRTPGCRRGRGAFAFTRPEDLLKSALNGLMERTPGVEKKDVEDILVGCAFPEAEQGLNVARIGAVLAGLPNSVGGITVNRFCASGISAVAMAADRIRVGEADIMIAAGVESMSMVPMMGNNPSLHPDIFSGNQDVGIAYGMGLTAEQLAHLLSPSTGWAATTPFREPASGWRSRATSWS